MRQNRESFCGTYKTNYLYKQTLSRAGLYASSKNFFESFAKGMLPILKGEKVMSNIVGIIPVIALPIVLLLANLVSLIVFIMYLCPGKFKTRKEHLSAKKQKCILALTIFCVIGLIVGYILFTDQLYRASDKANFAVCMFYTAQFDLFNGLEEVVQGNDYSFLGFDRLESYTKIFNQELSTFSELKAEFVEIQGKNYEDEGKRPLKMAAKFSTDYKNRKTLKPDESYAVPVWGASLTEYINDEIETDLRSMETVANKLHTSATQGLGILKDYGSDDYVLVSSMSRAMDFVLNKFKKVVNESVKFDNSLNYVLNFLGAFRYFLIVLGFMFFAFIPFYFYYYSVRTKDDTKVYLDKIMKLINLFINFTAFISGVMVLILFFIVAFQSSFCFYLNNFLSDPGYYASTKSENLFGITDKEIEVLLENCLDKDKAKFSFIFSSQTTESTSQNQSGTGDTNTNTNSNTNTNTNSNNGNTNANANTDQNANNNNNANANNNNNNNANNNQPADGQAQNSRILESFWDRAVPAALEGFPRRLQETNNQSNTNQGNILFFLFFILIEISFL